ncbi:MAG: DUF1844 domain-containing protein [Balneolales bacterium]
MSEKSFSEEQQDQLLFMMLVQQNEQIALMGLGKEKNPASDKLEKDLKTAKFAIDTLRMLEKYTANNIDKDLKEYLNRTLSNLRISYAEEAK